MFEPKPIKGEIEGKTLYLEPRELYDACVIEVKKVSLITLLIRFFALSKGCS